jgi:uncharacterized protein YaaW (UPF0174 family)
LEKVLAGDEGPKVRERLKELAVANPQFMERCKAAAEAWEIIHEVGSSTPVKGEPIPPFPQHRKAELMAAIRQMPINTMEPLALLKRFGRFEHAQVFGKILGYDPEIKTGRLTLKLSEWVYAEAHETEREDLRGWTKHTPGFETMVEQLISAATPTFSSRYDYRKVLLDIREHLKLDGYRDDSYAVIELQILTELIRLVREKVSKMPQNKKAAFYKSVEAQLLKEGRSLGGVSIEEILWAGGAAGVASVLGAEVTAGIILAHLGIGHAVLLALGLYAVPTVAIGAALFAPIAAVIGVIIAGRHNYNKTIPFVVALAALRQQQLNAVGSPGK